jgi:hypothetical protein
MKHYCCFRRPHTDVFVDDIHPNDLHDPWGRLQIISVDVKASQGAWLGIHAETFALAKRYWKLKGGGISSRHAQHCLAHIKKQLERERDRVPEAASSSGNSEMWTRKIEMLNELSDVDLSTPQDQSSHDPAKANIKDSVAVAMNRANKIFSLKESHVLLYPSETTAVYDLLSSLGSVRPNRKVFPLL